MTALAEWITELTSRGLRVFPLHGIDSNICTCWRGGACDRPGKHPRFAGWQTTATTTPDLDDFPDWCNIGIATGQGLVVIDVDTPDAVPFSMADHLANNPTFTVNTAKGFHAYYHTAKAVKSCVGWVPGVDVRGEGGLVVGPPSLHVSGVRYMPVDIGVPIALIPNMLELMLPAYVKRQVHYLPEGWESADEDVATYAVLAQQHIDAMGAAPEGERNARLFRHAAALAAYIADNVITPVWLESLRNAAVDAGLPQYEVDRTIASAAKERGFEASTHTPQPAEFKSYKDSD